MEEEPEPYAQEDIEEPYVLAEEVSLQRLVLENGILLQRFCFTRRIEMEIRCDAGFSKVSCKGLG